MIEVKSECLRYVKKLINKTIPFEDIEFAY